MKVTVSWSGGKDSALALHKLLQTGDHEVAGLHTVFGKETNRVGLHGVRRELIEAQAAMLDLPLTKLYLEATQDHDAYRELMQSYYMQCKAEGLEGVLFGDIFLEDLRKFREELLRDSGLVPVFPLWKKDSSRLINEFVQSGFKTTICSADASLFLKEQLGKTIDRSFIDHLPATIDPCGENGEFHTFVYDGPLFKSGVEFDSGEVIRQSYSYNITDSDGTVQPRESAFWFQELLPRIR